MKIIHESSSGDSSAPSFDDDDDNIDLNSVDGSENDEETCNTIQGEPNPLEEVKAIAKTETRRMKFWKWGVVLSLLATGAAVSSAIYVFLEDKQESDFQNQFNVFASSIADVTKLQVANVVQGVESLAAELTSYAIVSNSTWPFVTMPNFEVNANHAREQTATEVIQVSNIVTADKRAEYEAYTAQNQWWIEESRNLNLKDSVNRDNTVYIQGPILPFIYEVDVTKNQEVTYADPTRPLYTPVWQFSPPPFNPFLMNVDPLSIPAYGPIFNRILTTKATSYTNVYDISWLANAGISDEDHDEFHAKFVKTQPNVGKNSTNFEHPHTTTYTPIFRDLSDTENSDIVAYITSVITFDRYVGNLLPDDVRGIHMVLVNSCGQAFTYFLDGSKGIYLGPEDLHEEEFDYLEVRIPFTHEDASISTLEQGYCVYEFRLYPSAEFKDDTSDSLPFLFTILAAVVFAVITIIFFVYNWLVERRNTKIVDAAAKSNAVILSLFPANIRDKLLAQHEWKVGKKQDKGFIRDLESEDTDRSITNLEKIKAIGRPIAELFPNCTVFFGDLAGFTAWSSVREPTQVFVLLETLYGEFDKIAKRRKVFKVETIGDCYVAVCGLPTPRHDHAVVMARFARDCMFKMNEVVADLELELGPGTNELSLRVGLHSGPVTAGVLRGDRARFQLFGDTVNTASRMESTGVKGRIQMSRDTAEQLIVNGKQEWLQVREDRVHAKGKGDLETFFLKASGSDSKTSGTMDSTEFSFNNASTSHAALDQMESLSSEKVSSLIRWNVEMLTRFLKEIVASRSDQTLEMSPSFDQLDMPQGIPLDEVVEVIEFPDSSLPPETTKLSTIALPPRAKRQLHDFVRNVAALYKSKNAFHNFEHASHVAMSVVKLLSRIATPANSVEPGSIPEDVSLSQDVTYGITSDPLTQFACVFAALIHDVDHEGVPNTILVQEKTNVATLYNCRSVAEQNSVDLAWGLFMQDDYADLRMTICPTKEDFHRFRQLVVNQTLATDIMDKDLKNLRNQRWEKAFHPTEELQEDRTTVRNRKATIVLEHLIQASDVAHTMQHWHIYRKWNECLFNEMTTAFLEGRSYQDPAEFWYKGELGFFDYYIIPLAKKLKECGVFGVSSDEYLAYALKNRDEWAARGQALVEEMCEKRAVCGSPEVSALRQAMMEMKKGRSAEKVHI